MINFRVNKKPKVASPTIKLETAGSVDDEGTVVANSVTVGTTLTKDDGTNTVTTVTAGSTVSAGGTINVPAEDTIEIEGMEITMGTDGSDFALGDSKIDLPAGSIVQDATDPDSPAITVAEGVTGATVSTEGSDAGTVSASSVTIGDTVLTSTSGDLTVSLDGETSFPNGGTVTTTTEGGSETVRNVSINGSATVSADGSASYPSTGSPNVGTIVYPDGDTSSDDDTTTAEDASSGMGGGVFGTNQTCTRAQIITFLYCAAGSPEVTGSHSFVDVEADAYYEAALIWAVENGITTGITADTFEPNTPCTRSQIVTFLYRLLG